MSEALSDDLPFAANELPEGRIASLTTYRMLGKTGLRVSPLAYGAGSFGDAWGDAWSSGKAQAREIFDRYLEAGGNFFDTSNAYQGGESEEWLGEFIKSASNRERVVVSTKGTMNQIPGDPNGGGNGRKHILNAFDASLKRLGTDYIDVYYLHQWDMFTPIEEVLDTFDTLIRQGKLLAFGLSNFPAWYVAKIQTLAGLNHRNPVSSIQNQYSLAARHADYEHLPMCDALDISFTAWSPLANGLLTGKYSVDDQGNLVGAGRLTDTWTTDPSTANLTLQQNIAILRELVRIAEETGHSASQIALNWMVNHRGVTSAVIGARKLSQLEDNLAALEFSLDKAHVAALDAVSEMPGLSPYTYHTNTMLGMIHTGARIARV
ncbi:aldo/keto reductase [Ruegeria arenilitoris]|uniref:aldo/keto reductase n=1 Tax=Ruegeria arenilitoris TaxID=1173585 RepID=UPI0014812C89|nr:aldo/keto reductase [Ruegeria arenilitoris]